MRNVEAVRYKQRLDNLFVQISVFSDERVRRLLAEISASSDQIEMQSHWARYLCVLVSGFIETAVRAIYTEYANSKAAPYVANYASSRLEKLTNINMEDILVLAGSFNSRWRDKLERETDGELKDAVDTIVANRNRIAHGENVGITFNRIKTYYDKALKVVDIVEKIVLESR